MVDSEAVQQALNATFILLHAVPNEIFSGDAYLIGPGMDQDGKGLAKIGFSFGRDQSRAAYLQRQGDITGHPGSGRLLPSAGEMQTLNIASLQRT